MRITAEQNNILKEYNIKCSDDVNVLLLDLDAKITEIGFNPDYSLNKVGLKLQRLYDQLYNQN